MALVAIATRNLLCSESTRNLSRRPHLTDRREEQHDEKDRRPVRGALPASLHGPGAGLLLLVVLGLVVTRPRGLDVAWFAGAGGALAVVSGLLPLPAVGAIIARTWDAVVTLIALVLLSQALESNRFFDWAASHVARAAGGSGWRLYILVLLLTSAVAALLANDGAVLMLTPIYATLLRTVYRDDQAAVRLPFLLATGFFADAMSALFIPSNLTNIIVADATGLDVPSAALHLAAPMAAAFLVGGAAFALRFRGRLGTPYDPTDPDDPTTIIRDRVVFWAGWAALGGMVAGYIVGGNLHLPVASVALPAGVAMLMLVDRRRLRPAREALATAPWPVLIYALGMFAVLTAAYDAGVLGGLVGLLRDAARPGAGFPGIVVVGGLATLVSAAVNNLPAALLGVFALGGDGHGAHTATYALILGVDIGPKLTPFGSLATLLWLRILAQHDIRVSWGQYIRENWWITLLVVGASLGVLELSQSLLGG